MTIQYVIGDATRPRGDGPKLLCHIVNDRGGWGKGFVLAVSKRWDSPEQYYRRWSRMPSFGLGKAQMVQVTTTGPSGTSLVTDDLWVCNMVAQHGYRAAKDGTPPIRYDALRECLKAAWMYASFGVEHVEVPSGSGASTIPWKPASVHMPRIGTGLAGGKWEIIEPMIVEELCAHGIEVTVYDLK